MLNMLSIIGDWAEDSKDQNSDKCGQEGYANVISDGFENYNGN
jgi:hypothetical protein